MKGIKKNGWRPENEKRNIKKTQTERVLEMKNLEMKEGTTKASLRT